MKFWLASLAILLAPAAIAQAEEAPVLGQIAATIDGEVFELWIPTASRQTTAGAGSALSLTAFDGMPGATREKPELRLSIRGKAYEADVDDLRVLMPDGTVFKLGENEDDKVETATLMSQGDMLIFTVLVSLHTGRAQTYGGPGTPTYVGHPPVMVSLQGLVELPPAN